MTLWEQRGNELAYFAMKVNNGQIYMVSFDEMCQLRFHAQTVITDFDPYPTFQQWVRRFDDVY